MSRYDGAAIHCSGRDTLQDPEFGEGRDPTGFPVKASLLVDLKALDPKARTVLFGLTAFGEEGFKPVEVMFMRVVDVTSKDRRNHRDLMATRYVSKPGDHGDKNLCVLGKISKEFTDQVYWRWRATEEATGKPPLSLPDYLREQGTTLEVLEKAADEKKRIDAQEKKDDEEVSGGAERCLGASIAAACRVQITGRR